MKLSLYRPVKPYSVNQPFGVNGAYYRANGININGHNGIDMMAYVGQPIYASHDGHAFYQIDDSGGHGVVVVSNQTYDYKGQQVYMKTIYWHMVNPVQFPQYPQPIPATGSTSVKAGDLLGFADTTGMATGPHLHFGLKPIVPGVPTSMGDAPDVGIGNWVNVEQNNGYLGAIDPAPYLNGLYAHDIPLIQEELSLIQKVLLLIKQLV